MATADQNYNFEELVEVHFQSMMTERGFRAVSMERTLVRYESDRVYLNVYHGRRSYELAIEVDLLDSARNMEPGFSLGELMDLYAPDEDKDFRYFVARTPHGLEKGIRQLAERVERYANPVLTGDSVIFTRLHEQRERWKRDFAEDVRATQVRPKAEAAFRQKDYGEAARLYESIRGILTRAERKKLVFAQERRRTATDHGE